MDHIEQSNGSVVQRMHSDHVLYIKHLAILVVGGLSGLVAAYFFNLIPFDFSAEIVRARSLGIVSLTTLSGYPKFRDTLAYASLLGFPTAFAIIPWYVWARNKKQELASFLNGTDALPVEKDYRWALCAGFVILFYAYACFTMNGFFTPGWNRYVGAWLFLGEDGENLAWAQSILSGGVYGKDFFCLYGPMLIYPLTWVMKVFQTSVAVERYYKYALDLVAYGIVIFFLYKTVRSKTAFVAFSVLYLFVFPPFLRLSINFTYLRFILGMLPLLLLYLYLGSRKSYLLLLTGVVIGQSLLFSQEAGTASCIAVCAALLAHFLVPQRDWRSLISHGLTVTGAGLLSVMPMIVYLWSQGALGFFLDSLYGFPRLASLGSGAIPAPSFRTYLEDPYGDHFYYYWVIFFYAYASVYLLSRMLIRKPTREDILKFSILVFGVVLNLVAVRRYDLSNTNKVFYPALLLMFLLLDGAWSRLQSDRKASRVGSAVLLGGLTICTLALFIHPTFTDLQTEKWKSAFVPSEKFSRPSLGYEIPSLKRGGIRFDRLTAATIVTLQSFLDSNTRPGDYVYFFPNEAAYYFLFDRNNPTRYAISYFAITAAQRKDLIADLEKNKPEYVIFSKATWRVDNIREDVQVPEVVDYINRTYFLYSDMNYFQILKRKTDQHT